VPPIAAQPAAPVSESLVPNVRRVNGTTGADTRQRLMLAFNTPFHPEILVASSVMAAGVDLHLNCRYVLHHDLCWNPSTLEQRTGRVDRIGAKAETDRQLIHVYIPFVAETQDEKMYRVVMDRERWFHIVPRNLPLASLEVLPKPWFPPGFVRFQEVFAELPGQRIEVISLPGCARRAGAPARAAAVSGWRFCLGLKAVCGGGGSDKSHCCKRETCDLARSHQNGGHH
jgi:hypothetical protein